MIMSNEEKNNRELDAWIAEHVFGWKRWNFDNGFPETRKNYLSKDNEKQDKYRKRGFIRELPLIDNFPRYTTDASAAMMVLKKCCDEALNQVEISHEFNPWEVRTRASHAPGDFIEAHGETLELAIAKFSKQLFTK